MKRIVLLVLSILSCMAWAGSANAKESEGVTRNDCHLSFLVPTNLEYVEVEDAITTGKDECYLAFKYSGDMRIKPEGHVFSVPEDWRAMTDFALTVKSIPLLENIAQIESDDGAKQHGLFKLETKEHIPLPGGDLYISKYSAVKPTQKMVNLHQLEETVFVAGNSVHSVAFFLYSGSRLTKKDREKVMIFRDLFSSFRFF
ncbi:hypothetical protein F6X37_35985 [Paraburkholderia sp. 31.1]|uniref:hypothetical protein n=1 Tax=Paraburkholderia sp. 31.1 TaxID=2615205 RepID=UPI0016559D93|nr:hypothetical protein [Paraburkholderia sp. 31.1]MBC8726694.1 hypothetical protein [Paraburkholderia sp. 31.1]